MQFFFLTLCVAGRSAILSRLADEKTRPILTPKGEFVVSLWRHLHTLNPALTASNSVIMPDHVHLLLIANYDRDPSFRPLVFIHWFMEETERMMAATDGGGVLAPLPTAVRNAHGTLSAGERGAAAPVLRTMGSLLLARGSSKPVAATFGSIPRGQSGRRGIPIAFYAMPTSAIRYWRPLAHGMPSAISRSSPLHSFSRCASRE